MTHVQDQRSPVVLITGAAHRLGATMARHLHQRGWRVLIHCRSRRTQADALARELNRQREDSATTLAADLADLNQVEALAQQAVDQWGRLDALINNASEFFPTPVGETSADDWSRLLHTNLRAPYFLLQGCQAALTAAQGVVINLIDIYSERPLADHPLYCASKAGLAALTRSWANDLGPAIRVNGVSPGAILWPDQDDGYRPNDDNDGNPANDDGDYRQGILRQTPLGRTGTPEDIAGAVAYLLCDAPFVTGQILSVDGGRSLSL
ncbi:MAG: pteridine reductase [Pseudomonadales bacterium]|nr:pteridine reductase [Pseudomonadales bacterium]